MRVEQTLEAAARRLPEKAAVLAGGARLTYAQLEARANRLGHALAHGGAGRGERVIVYLENSAEAAVAIYGVLKAGAVLCVVNPGTKADKLAWLIDHYRARTVLTEPRLREAAREAAARARREPWVAEAPFAAIERGMPDSPPPAPGIDLDLAMLVTTSGSTGVPKGVMMTHQNVTFAAGSITTYLESREDDVVLSVLPLAFDYGLYQLLMSVATGATLVLEKSFAYPAAVLQRLAEQRVTVFPLVPTVAAMLLQMKSLSPGMFPGLRAITSTAAALPPAHIRRLQELFPAARIYSMYGLTECKRCTWLPPQELERRPGSVGIAIPGTEAYVVDDSGARAAPGAVGELVIRGGHVMKGYWENPAATERALRPGPWPWESVLYTGDLFTTDADGFLYFVCRKDDIIKSRGQKVSPKEVENAIYSLPGVRDAAVFGVPDAVLGMAIKAVVSAAPDAGLTEREVIAHCARHLEDFMVPKAVEFRDELPRTATGKIHRRALQAEADAERA